MTGLHAGCREIWSQKQHVPDCREQGVGLARGKAPKAGGGNVEPSPLPRPVVVAQRNQDTQSEWQDGSRGNMVPWLWFAPTGY